jgi:hypothetical protein
LEPIPQNGEAFTERVKSILGNPLDLKVETWRNNPHTVLYLSSITNSGDLQNHILGPIGASVHDSVNKKGPGWDRILPFIGERDRQYRESMEDAVQDLMMGRTVVHLMNHPGIYSFETLAGTIRAPVDPQVERTVRGARISFVESFHDNISILRLLIRDPSLRVDGLQIGRRSRTNVGVLYLKNVASPKIVAEVHRRLARIDIDDVVNSGYLEQLITDNRWSLFSLTQSTERPDKVVAGIMEGRVAIITGGSVHAIIVPATVNELYQSPEDYYWGLWFGSFLRFFRILGNNVAVALPGLYIALLGVNPELLPLNFALTISGSRMGVAFPLIIEMLAIEVTVEIFREASLRLPQTISQTLGVTTGIVLGSAAVGAGLVSNATLVVAVVTAISS